MPLIFLWIPNLLKPILAVDEEFIPQRKNA